MLRGVIASALQFGSGENSGGVTLNSSSVPLRYLTLYWDKVVIPDSKIIHFELPNQDILIDAGVVLRPIASVKNSVAGPAEILQAQSHIAQELIESDIETDWAIHQVGISFVFPPEFQKETRTVRVNLQKTLPVPPDDVPFEDILDFKDRRKDELKGLHEHLDELYLEVLRSPDPSLSGKAAIAKFRASLDDLQKVSDERWKSTRKYDLSVDLNVDGAKLVTAAAAGAAFNFYAASALAIPLSALGGLISCIKVGAKVSQSFEPAKNKTKLGYLLKAQSEEIIFAPTMQSSGQTSPTRPTALSILSSEVLAYARSKLRRK